MILSFIFSAVFHIILTDTVINIMCYQNTEKAGVIWSHSYTNMKHNCLLALFAAAAVEQLKPFSCILYARRSFVYKVVSSLMVEIFTT